MNLSRSYNLLAVAALVLSAGWVIAWTGGLLTCSTTWPIRFGLLTMGLLIAGGSIALLHYCRDRNCCEFHEHIEALCRIDPRDLDNEHSGTEYSPLPPENPCRHISDCLRETILRQARELQASQDALAASNIRCHRAMAETEQIKAILSGLAEPILAINDFDELVLANRAAEDLLQLDMNNGEKRALERLVRCQELVDLLTTTCHRKTFVSRTDEIELPGENGSSRSYRVTASKLQAASGNGDSSEPDCRGAVAVLRDIGEQKVLQKRNAEFVSAVSHEMKTPLAGIKAYVELLVDGDAEDEETREEFLNVINGQTDRLKRLVDNMLNLARIEAGVVNVNKQTHSLNELLEEALHVVQPSAEAKEIKLLAELSPMYLGVLADRDMLLQSAINLLSNAVKYTPEKGRITLRTRLEAGQVRFEVEDTGVGLSEEDCQRIFEKFYRVNKDKAMAAGTGLGLPLAKHIVEDVHGGRLSLESTLGKGSTFIVTIPGTKKLT
jgi:two-component system phosphate regulon sensor histidine kinase PhoR